MAHREGRAIASLLTHEESVKMIQVARCHPITFPKLIILQFVDP
jgi:hypothetical protein